MKKDLLLQYFASIIGSAFIILSILNIKSDVQYNEDISVTLINKPKYIPLVQLDIVKNIRDFYNKKDSFSDINIHLLEDLINDNEYIQEAELYLDVNDRLNALIYCRDPLVRIIEKKGVSYADNNGIIPDISNVDKNLLVLTGPVSLNSDLMNLVNYIYSNKTLNSIVGGVHLDKLEGYMLSLKNCNVTVLLGLEPVINNDQVILLKKFYKYLDKDLNCDYCRSINLKYNNQIICIK